MNKNLKLLLVSFCMSLSMVFIGLSIAFLGFKAVLVWIIAALMYRVGDRLSIKIGWEKAVPLTLVLFSLCLGLLNIFLHHTLLFILFVLFFIVVACIAYILDLVFYKGKESN